MYLTKRRIIKCRVHLSRQHFAISFTIWLYCTSFVWKTLTNFKSPLRDTRQHVNYVHSKIEYKSSPWKYLRRVSLGIRTIVTLSQACKPVTSSYRCTPCKTRLALWYEKWNYLAKRVHFFIHYTVVVVDFCVTGSPFIYTRCFFRLQGLLRTRFFRPITLPPYGA